VAEGQLRPLNVAERRTDLMIFYLEYLFVPMIVTPHHLLNDLLSGLQSILKENLLGVYGTCDKSERNVPRKRTQPNCKATPKRFAAER
jgi:hypothetical protein